MSTLLFNLFAQDSLYQGVHTALSSRLSVSEGNVDMHTFPDGESYLRVTSECDNRDAIILADLHQPNAKILPLIYLCEALREEGIKSITLLVPYLPYMRQDIQFKKGECVTSKYFAKLLSQHLDGLVTIDPHLHRYHSLNEIYSLRSVVCSANPLIADWVKQHIDNPLVVGPDSESEQWAAEAADMIGCPYIILEKTRTGDKQVAITAPGASKFAGRTPVLIDDIISTGRTMIVTSQALKAEGLSEAVCIGVHALFSEDAYEAMQDAPIASIYSCNTVNHPTNKIEIAELLADGFRKLLV